MLAGMTTSGDVQKKRGSGTIKTGVWMLFFGVVIAVAMSAENGSPGLQGLALLVAVVGLCVTLSGLSKRGERPAGD